jgi:ribosomal-protein-alanine N-acetyltransferase
MTRRVEPVHLAAVGPLSMLHRACFPEDPWSMDALSEIIRIPGFFGLIAWERDIPAGFALALDLGKECEILSLGVLRDRRRAGIGTALLEAVCCEAGVRGAKSVVLETAIDNRAACALYTARGFAAVGFRPNYYHRAERPADAVIMRLSLAAEASAT